jgi:uncharacterized protein (TIGR03437 family)
MTLNSCARRVVAVLLAFPAAIPAASTVYAGASYGLFRSTDNGASWSLIDIPLNSPLLKSPIAPLALSMDPNDPNKLYFIGNAGARAFFATKDGGKTWTATPFVAMSGQDVTVDFAGQVVYITATESASGGDRLLFKTTNSGATWNRLKVPSTAINAKPTGSSLDYIAADAAVSGTVYAVTDVDEFYKSTDFGETWTFVSSQITLTDGTRVPQTLVRGIYQDPLDPKVWYNATDHGGLPATCPLTNGGICGIFRSTDGGATFTGLSLPSTAVTGLGISAPPGTVYAAAEVSGLGGAVMKTTDAGTTWTPIKNGLFGPQSGRVWASPTDPNILFVNDNDSSHDFYVSTDAGGNFVRSVIPQGPPGCVPGNCQQQDVFDVVIAPTPALSNVSGASFQNIPLAPESIVSAFAKNLATGNATASEVPLPTSLLGTVVKVADSASHEQSAPLFFVSPGQVNYLMPAGTALGPATITITSGDGTSTKGYVQISAVAPGVFQYNSSGLAAALLIRVKPGNVQSTENVYQLQGDAVVPLPIDFGPQTDQIYVELFSTGVRMNSGLANAAVTVGGRSVPVQFVGAAPGFIGLDQINAGPLPRSLAGSGKADINITVDGRPALVTNLVFQ